MKSNNIAPQPRTLTPKELEVVHKSRKAFLKGTRVNDIATLKYWIGNDYFLPKATLKIKDISGNKEFWKKFMSDEGLFDMLKEFEAQKQQAMENAKTN